MVDAATKEQADEQPTLRQDEEADDLKEDEEVPMDVDDDDIQVRVVTLLELVTLAIKMIVA